MDFFRAMGILATAALVPTILWGSFVWYDRVARWRDIVNRRLDALEAAFCHDRKGQS